MLTLELSLLLLPGLEGIISGGAGAATAAGAGAGVGAGVVFFFFFSSFFISSVGGGGGGISGVPCAMLAKGMKIKNVESRIDDVSGERSGLSICIFPKDTGSCG